MVRGKFDMLAHRLVQAIVVLPLVVPIGNRACPGEHCARQSKRLQNLELVHREQFHRLIANAFGFLGELLQRRAPVAPLTDGLLDVAVHLCGRRRLGRFSRSEALDRCTRRRRQRASPRGRDLHGTSSIHLRCIRHGPLLIEE
jgi:hypothetical protein